VKAKEKNEATWGNGSLKIKQVKLAKFAIIHGK